MLRLSSFLNDDPRAIDLEEARSIARDCGIGEEKAVSLMLAAYCGLDLDKPKDKETYHRCFPHMLKKLPPALVTEDPYVQALRTKTCRRGTVTLEEETYAPAEIFVADDFRQVNGMVLPQLGWFDTSVPYPALKEQGRIWMTVTPNEINTIHPCAEASVGKVLCYGLGMGYYVFHALQNAKVTSVTVVEQSRDVIDLFREALLPMFPRKDDVQIVQGDAFAYAREEAPHQAFDTVFTDLWHDVSDGLPMYRKMKQLEVQGPKYLYWIEPTMRYYL